VRGRIFILYLLFVLGSLGCSRQLTEPPVGEYRATLTLPGGDAPFGLEIAKENDRYVLHLTNGAERTHVSNVRVAGGELLAVFPGYENSLRARIGRDELDGAVTLIKAGGKEQVIAFKATLGETWRFHKQASSDNADVAGRWETILTNEKGTTTKAIAIIEQQHDRVTGTVLTPTGDHRYLEGQVRGDEVQLSTFAGGLAYLYRLKVTATGALEGEYWQGLASHESVSRDAHVAGDDSVCHQIMQSDRLRPTITAPRPLLHRARSASA
jgi:hypothetical protein